MFQSLIGTLQTKDKKRNIYKKIGFQSLIGTLQTKRGNYKRAHKKQVSIPYRYATNKNI